MTHYTRSDGTKAEIASLPYPHLKAATAKLEARLAKMLDEHRRPELDAMRRELAARDIKFQKTKDEGR